MAAGEGELVLFRAAGSKRLHVRMQGHTKWTQCVRGEKERRGRDRQTDIQTETSRDREIEAYTQRETETDRHTQKQDTVTETETQRKKEAGERERREENIKLRWESGRKDKERIGEEGYVSMH